MRESRPHTHHIPHTDTSPPYVPSPYTQYQGTGTSAFPPSPRTCSLNIVAQPSSISKSSYASSYTVTSCNGVPLSRISCTSSQKSTTSHHLLSHHKPPVSYHEHRHKPPSKQTRPQLPNLSRPQSPHHHSPNQPRAPAASQSRRKNTSRRCEHGWKRSSISL